jgi:hypothetical protein
MFHESKANPADQHLAWEATTEAALIFEKQGSSWFKFWHRTARGVGLGADLDFSSRVVVYVAGRSKGIATSGLGVDLRSEPHCEAMLFLSSPAAGSPS